jgi:outer membrane protein TolC
MKNMKEFIILFLIIFTNFIAAQEINAPAALKELTVQAFGQYPRLKEAEGLVNLNEIKVGLAKAGYLPIAKIDAGYTTLDPVSKISIPMGPSPKEFQIMPNDNYNAALTVQQPIIDFKTSAGVDKGLSELAVSNDNFQIAKTQLAYQVAQLYYGIIFLNKSVEVQRLQLNLIAENLKLIEAKIKNGDALAYDLVSTQVRFTNVENYYADLQNQLKKQYNILNMLTGKSGFNYVTDTSVSFAGCGFSADSVINAAENFNQELKLAGDRIASAEWDVVSAQNSMYPTLSFNGSIGYKNGIMPEMNDLKFNYAAGLALTIPILSPSRPSIQKELAAVGVENYRNAFKTQKLTLSKDILNAIDDIKKNEKKYMSADTLIAQARMALDLAGERYKRGVITNLDLLTAQTNLQDALLNKLQTEYNTALSKLELNRLAGRRWWQ